MAKEEAVVIIPGGKGTFKPSVLPTDKASGLDFVSIPKDIVEKTFSNAFTAPEDTVVFYKTSSINLKAEDVGGVFSYNMERLQDITTVSQGTLNVESFYSGARLDVVAVWKPDSLKKSP